MSGSKHILIVQAPYYKDVSEMLLSGATSYLQDNGYTFETITVPGALEIPSAINFVTRSNEKTYHGYLALGCVIRGETSHYDIVCHESARGLYDLAYKYDLAIGNAILTCDTKDQAVVRADPKQKNKGRDAAEAVHALINIKTEYI